MSNRRKELIKEYKERKPVGGVYKITNTVSGKYVIDQTANIQSARNQFEFSQKLGSPMLMQLKKDWAEFGGQAFTLEVLEEVEQRADQTQVDFLEELKTLKQLHQANFDASKAY